MVFTLFLRIVNSHSIILSKSKKHQIILLMLNNLYKIKYNQLFFFSFLWSVNQYQPQWKYIYSYCLFITMHMHNKQQSVFRPIVLFHLYHQFNAFYQVHLPLIQSKSVHPASHLSSHCPFTWLHWVLSLQCLEHCWLQLAPYHPSVHSGYLIDTHTKKKTKTKTFKI